MYHAVEFKRLVGAGRIPEAIELCRRRLADPVGAGFYAYWLQRLTQEPPTPAPRQAPERPAAPGVRRHDPAPWQALHSALAAHPYQVPEGRVAGDADLQAQRAAWVQRLPFRSEIFLPTERIGLAEQVTGLQRVAALLEPRNLEASRQRFAALRAEVRRRGCRRIFVVGNGPSLKRTDLELLAGEITIGFNGIFLHERFTPTIYVVEDHLVAEDRRREIHDYECPVKVFPSYLGYCIEPQANTIYLNHLPRNSYPVDTDFSADAGTVSYTGGTVTYTGLQIAASLGAEEIVLVGVDASYRVAHVERSDAYGTGVLTSTQDDVNHFDPRYFGRGYRWHDPNVHTMLQAYRKARDHARRNGWRIVNATVGGQLEVFERADYHRLFAPEVVHPRVAVVDFTSVNRPSATGALKRRLLQGWPGHALLHVHADDPKRIAAMQAVEHDQYAPGADERSLWPAWRALVEFDPQVLYLRPTLDRPAMTLVQMVAAQVLGRPFVLHYMDDWLEKAAAARGPEAAAQHRAVMAFAFARASRVLAISRKMADHLVERHGVAAERVEVVHNFMPEPLAGPPPGAARPGRRVVRYFGGMEPDMGLDTLREVARQVHEFNRGGPAQPLEFELYTGRHYRERHAQAFAAFEGVRLHEPLDDEAYRARLADSDLNLLCYNFDRASLDYVRYSMANKLPELLAAGVPFLAIGHPETATIELLARAGYPFLLTEPSFRFADMLRRALAPDEATVQACREALAGLADEFAEDRHRGGLHRLLRRVAAEQATLAAAAEQATLPAAAEPAFPLRALHALCAGGGRQPAYATDAASLLGLAVLPPGLTGPVLERIRAHGLEWSVRQEVAALEALLPDPRALEAAPAALQARALACLVVGLGEERFDPVCGPVRQWLGQRLERALRAAPARGPGHHGGAA